MNTPLITTPDELDALPENTFFRCACGHHGRRITRGRFTLGARAHVSAREIADGHLPLTVLWRPDQTRSEQHHAMV